MNHSRKLIWLPKDSESSLLIDYMNFLNIEHNQTFKNYEQLHRWSIEYPENFWSSFTQFVGINFKKSSSKILERGDQMIDSKWFVGSKLNFAEHLISRKDSHPAIIYRDEKGRRKVLSYKELFDQVRSFAKALVDQGVKEGDVVGAIMTNCPETIIAMLASSAIGAIWTSCSPDFGVDAILDRIGQVKPKVLIAINQYEYSGKKFNLMEKITAVSKKLEGLSKVFMVQHLDIKIDYKSIENAVSFSDYLNQDEALQFNALPFDHPLFIMYSSGTTGKPKCIIHSAGGTLIQHMKEHQLHLNLKPDNRLFFFTTCGWMMWNWLVSALASKATIILYEGSPFYPHNEFLWAIAEDEKISHFGISPRYITTMMKENIRPLEKYNLKSLQTILSTGSPLLSDHFQYIQDAIKSDVQISSISGGTDIISCFALGNPMVPVFDGEIQSIGLGMAVKVFNDAGQEAAKEEKGELVCTQPFPSMPIGFFNDPDKKKYKQSYFNKFENTWAHGDFATITENNGVIIFGRSDTTLNSGGVRIGTAEIYRQTEKMPQILDAVVVETTKSSEPIVTLFVVLKKEEKLTNDLVEKIKYELKTNASPRHIPKHIIQVDDIPRTISGKISELSVKAAIEGEEIKNIDALANPDSLSIYRKFAKEN
jgi:acetoacetyl-CoA synthetase